VPRPDSHLFLNRELSWLAFNERVLAQAADPSLPLYERLKFIAIVSSNFDEFFMVRVAGLKQQLLGQSVEAPADGLSPAEQLDAISQRAHALVTEQARIYEEVLRPALADVGIHLLEPGRLDEAQREAARQHFRLHVAPALTPLAIDPGHPFPQLRNRSLNVAVLLHPRAPGRGQGMLLAVIQVPSVLPRLAPLPSVNGRAFMFLGELIAAHAGELFEGYEVFQAIRFRLTRNSDLAVEEDESEDLLSSIQRELRYRDRGAAVRLELSSHAPSADLEELLCQTLTLDECDLYRTRAPLQLQDLMQLPEAAPRPDLRFEPFSPAMPATLAGPAKVVDVIARHDLLLHHPYESFEPVVRFVEEAADDPQVLAIKQTLYRTSGDSPFVRALSRAASNGKQVTALVELKARFDEANNIAWARQLEENGVHVVYGMVGLKTHCKVALVVRREADRIRRYVHLGTGNYNPQTARLYSDVSFFTAREEIGEDAAALFNLLTGYSEPPAWRRLAVAPFDLQARLLALVEEQAVLARRGLPAAIAAKMNSLVDPTLITALYAASQAGVKIDLVVRGICCLRPGVPGVSERIRVVSIVDRFLEHSRVFSFGVGERAQVYIASSDWMPRNFHRRIEVMCLIEDPPSRARLVEEVLEGALGDDVNARELQADGGYRACASSRGRRCQATQLSAARLRNAPPPLVTPIAGAGGS
jgi:polyphosphate kinase